LEEYYDTDDIEAYLDLPIRMSAPTSIKPLYASREESGNRVVDEFGVVWTTNAIDRGAPIGPPLRKPSLEGYRFPDPAAAYRFEDLEGWCRQNADNYTILWIGDLWERATFMCGMERLLLYVATEPDFVGLLLDRIAQYILDTLDILIARFSFDCIALSDDYGTQRSLVISPADWRQLVKPRLAAIFDRAASAGRTRFLHSCGNIRAVLPDLVELGLDILHPIQPEAMDILELKRRFGEELTFCGGLGTQELLVSANPDEVRREVGRLQHEMGRGGGYVLEPGITIQADVPLENIVAMIEAGRCSR
jgi:uroporphyrinogen decarboxylase